MKKTSISLYVFQVFKCLIYVLLTANIFFFYQEESLAVKSTFSQGISITDIIQGFAATLDTAAWGNAAVFIWVEYIRVPKET